MTGFAIPVRCDCGQVYDMCGVTVTARYSDCSVWNAPCCGRQCDDRPKGWGGGGYTELEGHERLLAMSGHAYVDSDGRMYRPMIRSATAGHEQAPSDG